MGAAGNLEGSQEQPGLDGIEPANILVVDDHRANLLALTAVLEPLGGTLLTAKSGEEALQVARTHDLAAVLLDVQMPGMDGFETASRLRELEGGTQVPIIFVTASEMDEQQVMRGHSLGAVDYMIKPFAPATMLSKVGTYVGLFQRRRKLENQLRATVADDVPNILVTNPQVAEMLLVEGIKTTYGLPINIVFASTGKQALSQLLEKSFALILLDLDLPDVNGIETAETLRGYEQYRQIPLVLLAHSSCAETDVAHGYGLGAVDFLFLPVKPDYLHGKVKALLNQFWQESVLALHVQEITRLNNALRSQQERTDHLKRIAIHARGLIEAAVDPMVVVSANGDISEVNEAAETITGRSREELIGTHFGAYFASPDEARDGFDEVMRDGKVAGRQLELMHSSGRVIPVMYSAAAFRDEHGEFVGVFAVARDITDQLCASEALANSEKRYRMLAENATDIVWFRNADGVLEWISPSVTPLLGWTPEELIGSRPPMIVHPDDLALAAERIGGLSAGRPLPPTEIRMLTVDGDSRWMSMAARPVIDPDGSVSGLVAGARDIHEHVLSRQASAQTDRLFRLAMDAGPQGMALVDLDLRFSRVNRALCEMLDRDEAWFLSHTVKDVTYPADLEAEDARRDQLLKGEVDTTVREHRWLKADGSTAWVLHSIAVLRDDAQEPLSFVIHVQDNTEAHATQAKLVFRATHDPLTGLVNSADVRRRIADLLSHTPRRSGVTGLLYCDLDDFKQINDTYGHDVGDEVLQAIAQRVASVVRTDDIVSRLGGDEFVVVLNNVYDMAAAVVVAQKIRKAVSAPVSIPRIGALSVTISVGIALAGPTTDVQTLLRNADTAV